MLKKAIKFKLKAMVTVGALVWSYALGKKIGDAIEADTTIDEEQKPIITVVSCSLAGYITGLIARYIVKRI